MSFCRGLLPLTALVAFAASVAASEAVVLHGADGLPDRVVVELKAIAAAAGDAEITVAGTQRSVRKQVEVIIDYYIECNADDAHTRRRREAGRCGVAEALEVYDPDCREPLGLYSPEAGRADNVARISEKLTETLTALGEARSCMVHVELPGITLKNVAVDIAPSSVDDPARFHDAVRGNPAVVQRRFFYPEIPGRPRSEVADSAFHLEFLRR